MTEIDTPPKQADFPPCERAGRGFTDAGQRACKLYGRLKWVTLRTCQACPLAGLVADAAAEAEAKLASERPAKAKAKPRRARAGRKATRSAPKIDLTCIHRGERYSTIGCAACGGTKEIPTFACALHEECTVEIAGDGVKWCARCKDRTPQLVQLGESK